LTAHGEGRAVAAVPRHVPGSGRLALFVDDLAVLPFPLKARLAVNRIELASGNRIERAVARRECMKNLIRDEPALMSRMTSM